MITMQEAKDLYDKSGIEVTNYFDQIIDPRVREAAQSGKQFVDILVDSEETWRTLQMTPLQQRVVDRLKELGFSIQFGRFGDAYVPRGLADDDGNGPKHTNYGFHISGWSS